MSATARGARTGWVCCSLQATFCPNVTHNVVTKHTLFVGNDNDFLATLAPPVGDRENPNQWFVFGFSDADLPSYVPQQFTRDDDRDRDNDHDRDQDRGH